MNTTTTTTAAATSTSLPTMYIPHPFPWAIKRQRECYSLVAQSWIGAGRISLTDVLIISEMFRGFIRYSALGLSIGFLTSLSVIPTLQAIHPRFFKPSRALGYSRLPVIVRTGMTLTGGFYGAYWGLGLPFERYGRPFTGDEVKRRVLTVPFLRGYLASFTSLRSPTNTNNEVCFVLISIYLGRDLNFGANGNPMQVGGCLGRVV